MNKKEYIDINLKEFKSGDSIVDLYYIQNKELILKLKSDIIYNPTKLINYGRFERYMFNAVNITNIDNNFKILYEFTFNIIIPLKLYKSKAFQIFLNNLNISEKKEIYLKGVEEFTVEKITYFKKNDKKRSCKAIFLALNFSKTENICLLLSFFNKNDFLDIRNSLTYFSTQIHKNFKDNSYLIYKIPLYYAN